MASQSNPSSPNTTFFDGFFAICVVLVLILGSIDFLIGPARKQRIRGKVGDFWTRLQYNSVDRIFADTINKFTDQISTTYNGGKFSWRLIRNTFLTNVAGVLLVYGLLLLSLGRFLIYFLYGTWPIFAVLTVMSLLVGWIPYTYLVKIFRHSTQTTTGHIRLALNISVLILGNVIFVLICFFVTMILVVEFSPILLSWFHHALAEAMANAKLPPLAPYSPTQGADGWQIFVVIVVSELVAVPFCVGLLPPVLALALLLVSLFLLKLARPVIQPVLDLILMRLYETKQGILTTISVFIAAVSKLIEQIAKLHL